MYIIDTEMIEADLYMRAAKSYVTSWGSHGEATIVAAALFYGALAFVFGARLYHWYGLLVACCLIASVVMAVHLRFKRKPTTVAGHVAMVPVYMVVAYGTMIACQWL